MSANRHSPNKRRLSATSTKRPLMKLGFSASGILFFSVALQGASLRPGADPHLRVHGSGELGSIWHLPFKVEQRRTAPLDPFQSLACTVGQVVIAVIGNAEVCLTVCGKPCCAYFTAKALQLCDIDWTCQSHRAMSLFMLGRCSKLLQLLEQISVCPRCHMSTRAI